MQCILANHPVRPVSEFIEPAKDSFIKGNRFFGPGHSCYRRGFERERNSQGKHTIEKRTHTISIGEGDFRYFFFWTE